MFLFKHPKKTNCSFFSFFLTLINIFIYSILYLLFTIIIQNTGKGDGSIILYNEKQLRAGSSGNTKTSSFKGKATAHRIFTAHPGPITSLCIHKDMLVTCGESKKIRRRIVDASVIEGFQHLNSKCGYQAQYHSDNLCKVYDVRMLRQGMPLQFTYNSAPAYSTFLPTEETNSATPGKRRSEHREWKHCSCRHSDFYDLVPL